jgi:Tfp pilus assembly protein PilF
MTIAIPLKDIMIDPDREIDLVSMDRGQAVDLIKKSFAFLSTVIDVSIEDDIAFITFPEQNKQQVDRALQIYQDAVKAAENGKYGRAIHLFKKTLDILPNHTDALRNAAMAYLEAGNPEEAKNHLVELLRMDPKDAWGYLLLGNIYAKHENNLTVAEKFYLKAYELNPKDSYLLNNYAALMMERKKYEDGQKLFDEAISINPKYPNSYYGLALSYIRQGRIELALVTLDDLFKNSSFEDPRSKPVFKEARELYLETNRSVAQKKLDLVMGFVEDRQKTVEQIGGYAVKLLQDDTLEYVSARTQMAWKYKRDYHEIRYRRKSPEIIPHLLIHEMEHIFLEIEARKVGRNKIYMTTSDNRENSIRSVSSHVNKLRDMGYSGDMISKVILDMIHGLANQMFNCPLDMIIEKRIFDDCEILHPSQFASLWAIDDECLKVLKSSDIRKLTPPQIYKANIAMNCAYALCVDHIYAGRTEYSLPYRSSDSYSIGKKLYNTWLESTKDFHYGDEYLLVDEFARILNLQDWYGWSAEETVEDRREGVTNPELLKAKEPASMMYCLGALERYENMNNEDILKIAGEIALLGQTGIDYTKADRRYSLQSIPGEQFSGLQLMCLMYVGFQKIDPSMNVGMDLKDAYEMALKLHKPKR